MDWNYILSMATTAEDLEENRKDELLNTIAWYDFTLDKLDSKKYSALLHLCQEIMKYKSEQVDALLAELDEIAMNQTEEETHESDDRSSRLKKSYDNDEQNMKYRDLKLKYRKLQKTLDGTKKDNDQLKKNVRMLEQERVYLQNELRQAGLKDDSASDISETVKDQQKHLMENVQQKNSQISQLLTDIENVESDNLQLRSHLSTLRDDLSEATDKIESLMNQNRTIQLHLNESENSLHKTQLLTNGYKQQIDDLLSEKEAKETEFDEFAKEIDQRIDEWKKVLEAKNQEISYLKSNLNTSQALPQRPSTAGSVSSLPIDETQLKVLQKTLDEREATIIRLQKQIEKATKEMLKSTQIIILVSKERDNFGKKCEKMNSMSRELRKQLKSAHQRGQELSTNIEYYTKVIKEKENDIKEVIKQIKKPDLQTLLKDLDQIKSEKGIKEKKLSELVVNCNKLQSISDNLEKENLSLRERLGLTEDDFISTKSANFREKQTKKQFLHLQQKLNTCEEEKLQYRLEVQKLSKHISNLSDQLLDLGETPILEGQEINVSQLRETSLKLNTEKEKSVEIEYNTLLEENDALRKGLHEILESIKNKQVTPPKEIRSTTLEYLLMALDAKHVSGWYHPAMRLQAEVHTLQGSNNVLRDQLRSAREELDIYKEKSSHLIITTDSEISNAAAIANLNNHLINVLKNYKIDDSTNVKLVDKLETYKKEFLLIQEQICVLYNQYTEEKTKWEADLIMKEEQIREINAAYDTLKQQLLAIKDIESCADTEKDKHRIIVETTEKLIVVNRKLVYLENLEKRYKKEVDKLKSELLEQNQQFTKKEYKLKSINSLLLAEVNHLERSNLNEVIPENMIKLQNDYDQLLIKQRQLLQTLDNISEVNSNEIQLLKKSMSLMETEKAVLINKFASLKSTTFNDDDNNLRKKLAQAEITQTTERQRADHTNSLYELVKEQLAKSEERHQEYQKFNGDLIQKNLLLQESVKVLEDKIMHYVDGSKFKEVQKERDDFNSENQQLADKLINLGEELSLLKKEMASKLLYSNLDQSELHSLRHQIVDLQASGDDKAVIARLSSDVVLARTAEAEVRKKMDEITYEIKCAREEEEANIARLQRENSNLQNSTKSLRENNSHLKSIIKQQRTHYFGYIPYISQEKLQNKIASIANDKKLIYLSLERTERIEFDCQLTKETLEKKTDVLNELNEMIRDGDAQARILEKWFLEKTNVQLQELRYRRQTEFKEMQVRQAHARIQEQGQQIAQLEAELLQMLCLNEICDSQKEAKQNQLAKNVERLRMGSTNVVEIAPVAKSFGTTQTGQLQADSDFILVGNVRAIGINEDCEKLKKSLEEKEEEICHHKEDLQRLKQKHLELEMTVTLLRQQMGDKQSQINFYEKHILEMQQSKADTKNAENIHLLERTISEKEHIIFNLQSLLKTDRDEHSLAAARFQEELKQLQGQLTQQEQPQEKPARVAVDYYIQQVHALEKLTAELQTSVSTLSTQLQSSREECVRWRTLSNDRLQSVEELRIQLEEGHKTELEAYKSECEKWRNEVSTLQLYINSFKKDIVDLRPNIEKELKDKDNKIHELLITLRQLKRELNKKSQPLPEKNEENFEEIKDILLREQEILKKRCEQLLGREKIAREEIRTLKGQLMKRPVLSARTDSCPTKEQQSRKIISLEKQVTELREKLEREAALNEAHKAKVSADFDKWNKLKHWQQCSEKMKIKLREKTEECDKVQQTCCNYRMLIERLEREKHNLEVRLRNVKSDGRKQEYGGAGNEKDINPIMYATLNAENQKLIAEVDTLKGKLEQQQHHSGALSSVMLQDKLEAQERKIAILEMSAKGGGEMRAEMERVQNANSTLHKTNLRLETENLEMRLDLEKSSNELPHLREQINYLENYIKLVKSHSSTSTTDPIPQDNSIPESRRVSELERTVLALKRVVEKLQVENKRLANGNSKQGGITERTASRDRFNKEYNRLKQQYDDKVARVETLEKELNAKKKLPCGKPRDAGDAEKKLHQIQEELQYKTELLEKVKVLLQRAAVKEKTLLEQVNTLKGIIDSK